MSSPTTKPNASSGVAMLGLGEMGTALVTRLLDANHPVTVWNRSPGRAAGLLDRGAQSAGSITQAVTSQPLVVACLLGARSVHETLDPVADKLSGRTLINLTTTAPNEARELAAWAAEHSIDYLDGAILAVPALIGSPAAQIFCSGSRAAYQRHRGVLDTWATSTYDGSDAGMASSIDLAMLSAMYHMFAGFFHGAAMVATDGMSAAQFAARTTPFISAMATGFAKFGEVIDRREYGAAGRQSLEFSDLSHIVATSDEQGVNSATIAAVQALISQQIGDGNGSDGLARVYESLRAPDPAAGVR